LKLLVDENLAPSLATDLADLFPASVRVRSAELGGTTDAVIWEHAQGRSPVAAGGHSPGEAHPYPRTLCYGEGIANVQEY